MNFTEIDDDSEHSSHTPAERAKAASRNHCGALSTMRPSCE